MYNYNIIAKNNNEVIPTSFNRGIIDVPDITIPEIEYIENCTIEALSLIHLIILSGNKKVENKCI